MGLAILPVHLSVLEAALQLPAGYHLIVAQHEMNSPFVSILVESADIPQAPTAHPLPTLDLLVTEHWHPEDHSYRKYTAEVKVREDIRWQR
jgi:hypothetical protein